MRRPRFTAAHRKAARVVQSACAAIAVLSSLRCTVTVLATGQHTQQCLFKAYPRHSCAKFSRARACSRCASNGDGSSGVEDEGHECRTGAAAEDEVPAERGVSEQRQAFLRPFMEAWDNVRSWEYWTKPLPVPVTPVGIGGLCIFLVAYGVLAFRLGEFLADTYVESVLTSRGSSSETLPMLTLKTVASAEKSNQNYGIRKNALLDDEFVAPTAVRGPQ